MLCLILLFSLASTVRADLTAENLALIVNRNVPASRELALHYATVRSVPADRIIEIDLPDQTSVSITSYNRYVRDEIRKQLKERGIDDDVTCLVTFYGLPIRLDAVADPNAGRELQEVEFLAKGSQHAMMEAIGQLEALARRNEPAFSPHSNAQDFPAAITRLQSAADSLERSARRTTPDQRQAINTEAQRIHQTLARVPRFAMMPTTRPTTRPAPDAIAALSKRMSEPDARRELRQTVYFFGTLPEFWRVLEEQKIRLTHANSTASLDSELSLLWSDDYDVSAWQANTLNLQNPLPPAFKPLMVSRIDGGSVEQARRIIDDSIRVENEGLRGTIVIDARGITSQDGFGTFDSSLRRFHDTLVRARVQGVIFDDKPDLLPDNTSDQAMLYVGWYALRNYRPTVKFVPGAIGVHVASEEMIQLRPPDSGWCSGQLRDGVAVTMGAVSEPFLHAFPSPDLFFPLLLTGKFTLAETYWKSIPMSSWRLTLIGDPLYRPFAKSPVLSVEALPPAIVDSINRVER